MSENAVDDYGWQSSISPQSCAYLAPAVIAQLEQAQVRRVLDLGSGNGVLCSLLRDRGYDVVGVEYDQGGVTIASKAYPDIPFYRYGVQDDPQLLMNQESSFDAVVSTEVIEHLFSPHLLPAYASGVLKSNGILVVSTPYHGYLKNLAISVLGAWDKHHSPTWHGGHIKFWSKKTLSALLIDAGFEILRFRGVGRIPFLWKSMIVIARHGR